MHQGYQQMRNNELILAIEHGDAGSVTALLNQGADPNTLDTAGLPRSFAQMRAQWRHAPGAGNPVVGEPALWLVFTQASHAADSHRGLSAYDAVANALVTHGANPNVLDENHQSPLSCAAELGLHQTVRALLSRGADIHARYNGYALLMGADEESTALLLQHGADPNGTTDDGRMTVLMYNCIYGKEALGRIRLLLKAGADPNAKNPNGVTPLMFTHSPEVAALLLEHGADINARDNRGHSVLYHAEHYLPNHPERSKPIIRFLKQHAAINSEKPS